MKILSAHIDGFGRFADRDFTFTDGVNIVHGKNEAGKSTLHSFIEAMLLGPDKKSRSFSRSVYECMEPWDESVPYRGSLRIEVDGSVYRIERNFRKMHESFAVYDEATGQLAENPEQLLQDALCGLSPNACRNSILIGQLSAKTGAALERELKGYIRNFGSTMDPTLNARRAIEFLEVKKRNFRENIVEDAAKEYAATLGRIKSIEQELSDPGNDNRIRVCEERKNRIRTQLDSVDTELGSLRDRIDKAAETLKAGGIESRRDVTVLDEKSEELYREYLYAKSRKKHPLLTVGLILSLLMTVCGAAALLTKYGYGTDLWTLATGLTAVGGTLLAVLLVVFWVSTRKFREAKKNLSEFMKKLIGEDSVSEETVALLKNHIHSFDGILSEKESAALGMEELGRTKDGLTRENEICLSQLEEQHRIRFAVENSLMEENRLRSRASELRNVIAENNRLKDEIEAMDIAIDTIGDLSSTIGDRLGTYLNVAASHALSDLTAGHYRSLDIGSGAGILLNSKEGMINVADVSQGTMDQVYLSVRLAAARFMMQKGDLLPLLFDDSFALYDDERLRRAVSFIAKDYHGQMILFTCHDREKTVLEEGQYHLIEL